MIRRRHLIMSAALSTLALASCSGGDDNNGATPTPTTSPTSTPTASPTYSAFPLPATNGASEFNTINAATSYTGDPSGAVTLGVASTETLSTRVRLATDSALSTGVFVVRENTEESRFANANVKTAPAPAVNEFVFRTDDTTTAGKFSQLEFLNNTIPSQVTSNTALQLTNVSYASWWRGDSTTGAKRISEGVFGYPTVTTDLPKTGTQAYTATVTGRLVSVNGNTTVQKVSGPVTLNVDFSTGLVTITLALSTVADNGTTTTYGTFRAQGAIPVGQNLFSGSFISGSPLDGTITGGFFGSNAKEIGITFAGSGTFNGAQQRLVGVIVGKK